MNTKNLFSISAAAMLLAFGSASAQSTYNGNGSSAWGGAVGQGSVTVSDNGSTINFTLNRGPGTLDNALVIYIDSVVGGFSSTAGFNDSADGGRSAISGYTATGNGGGPGQSILNFVSGYQPDYAISIENGYASLFQLANGGNNSLNWITGAAQSGANNSATYSLSFNLSSLGLAAGQSFSLFGIEVSTSGWSSPEAIGGGLTGVNGWGGTQTQTSFSTYTTVPEPSTMVLGAAGMATLLQLRRRR